MKTSKIIFVLIIALLSFVACQENKNEVVLFIKHGSSANECKGYCFNETTFSKNDIINFKKAWRNEEPQKIDTLKFEKLKWDKIVKSIDLEEFFQLSSVYGCPDCADGGQEWIEIKTDNRSHKVIFDYNLNNIVITNIKKMLNKFEK